MRLLGPKSFPDVLKVFDEENIFKDGWYPSHIKDTWPRERFNEANSQFGEWNEFELSHTDLLDVKLHWNTGFEIPKEGMTVAEALQLPIERVSVLLGHRSVRITERHYSPWVRAA
jgi:hypothetical protein